MAEAAGAVQARAAWGRILMEQAQRRPRWQPQDMYKLAYQAALGSEHAAPGESAARHWLEMEIAGLGDGPDEPLLETISPDGRLVRVNLRPYLASGGDLERLLGAFLHTAAAWRGEMAVLQQYIDWAIELAEVGGLAFSGVVAPVYFQRLAQAGYPAMHHSDSYRQAYLPAYRVVMGELMDGARGVTLHP